MLDTADSSGTRRYHDSCIKNDRARLCLGKIPKPNRVVVDYCTQTSPEEAERFEKCYLRHLVDPKASNIILAEGCSNPRSFSSCLDRVATQVPCAKLPSKKSKGKNCLGDYFTLCKLAPKDVKICSEVGWNSSECPLKGETESLERLRDSTGSVE